VIQIIWHILRSKEIILLSLMLVIVLYLCNFRFNLAKRKSKRKAPPHKEKKNTAIREPDVPTGKIIVPDSTYDLLMKIKREKSKSREEQ